MATTNTASKILTERVVSFDNAGRPVSETAMYSDGTQLTKMIDYQSSATPDPLAPSKQITIYDSEGHPTQVTTSYYDGRPEVVENLDPDLEDNDDSTSSSTGGGTTTTTTTTTNTSDNESSDTDTTAATSNEGTTFDNPGPADSSGLHVTATLPAGTWRPIVDNDGDGIPDSTDTDDDDDGTPDSTDTDTDGDGIPDSTDTDDDNDGTPDSTDTDDDGTPDTDEGDPTIPDDSGLFPDDTGHPAGTPEDHHTDTTDHTDTTGGGGGGFGDDDSDDEESDDEEAEEEEEETEPEENYSVPNYNPTAGLNNSPTTPPAEQPSSGSTMGSLLGLASALPALASWSGLFKGAKTATDAVKGATDVADMSLDALRHGATNTKWANLSTAGKVAGVAGLVAGAIGAFFAFKSIGQNGWTKKAVGSAIISVAGYAYSLWLLGLASNPLGYIIIAAVIAAGIWIGKKGKKEAQDKDTTQGDVDAMPNATVGDVTAAGFNNAFTIVAGMALVGIGFDMSPTAALNQTIDIPVASVPRVMPEANTAFYNAVKADQRQQLVGSPLAGKLFIEEGPMDKIYFVTENPTDAGMAYKVNMRTLNQDGYVMGVDPNAGMRPIYVVEPKTGAIKINPEAANALASQTALARTANTNINPASAAAAARQGAREGHYAVDASGNSRDRR